MQKAIVIPGIVILIIALILSIIWYPVFGYASVDETVTELEDFDLEGKDVKFKGTVEIVYSNDTEGVGIAFDLVGITIIIIEGLVVESLLFGDPIPVYIICNNIEISKGDRVTVEGIGFNYGGISFIIGEEASSAVSKIILNQAPEPATVKTLPRPEFYIGFTFIVASLTIVAVGAILRKKPTPKYLHPPPQQSYEPQAYTPPPPTPPPPPQSVPPPPPPPSTPPPPPPPTPKEQSPPPPPTSSPTQYPCRYCRQPLTYVDKYQRWYCDYCRRYA